MKEYTFSMKVILTDEGAKTLISRIGLNDIKDFEKEIEEQEGVISCEASQEMKDLPASSNHQINESSN